MATSLRRSGGAAASLMAAALLLLLGLSGSVVEAKKVKRVKAGTTYKTHDRKLSPAIAIFGWGRGEATKERTSNRKP